MKGSKSAYLLFPGQGRLESRLLSRDDPRKKTLLQYVEQRLGRTLTEADFSDPVAYSALLVVDSSATLQHYRDAGGGYTGVAGYSVGQYAALAAAGCLDVEAMIDLVMLRARLMAQCVGDGYGMLAVLGCGEGKLNECINKTESDKGLHVATINGPFSFTISGDKTSLALLRETLLEDPSVKKAELLPVAGAWHSPFLSEAAKEFSLELHHADFRPPSVKFWDNVTGLPNDDLDSIRANLVRHITCPVQWEKTLRSMVAAAPDAFIECGAGTQLRQILFFVDRSVPVYGMNSNTEIKKCVESLA